MGLRRRNSTTLRTGQKSSGQQGSTEYYTVFHGCNKTDADALIHFLFPLQIAGLRFNNDSGYSNRMNDIETTSEAPEAQWMRLSEVSNALDYLDKAVRFIHEADPDPQAWKWVILSLHGSLYGFGVAACQGTDYEQLLTKNGKLLDFWSILDLCQDPDHMQMLVFSKPLKLSEEQRESIEQLKNALKNRIEHFVPTSWSIEIHGLPQMCIDALEVIRFLALETKTYIHLSEEDEQHIDKIIQDTVCYLKTTTLYREELIAKALYVENNPE